MKDTLAEYKELQLEFVANDYPNERGERQQQKLFLKELLIVFDEARNISNSRNEKELSILSNLRRAQKYLNSKNCLLVFIDTLSKMSNFTPAHAMDGSARQDSRFHLLEPFYDIYSVDAMKYLARKDSEFELLLESFSLGRPLWGAQLINESISLNESSLGYIIDFAKMKLLCESNRIKKTEVSIVENPGFTAASCIRFGILGVMDHTTASQLMSSHMATGKFKKALPASF